MATKKTAPATGPKPKSKSKRPTNSSQYTRFDLCRLMCYTLWYKKAGWSLRITRRSIQMIGFMMLVTA